MKLLFSLIVTVGLLLTPCIVSGASTSTPYQVYLDNQLIQLGTHSFKSGEYLYVDAQPILEADGLRVLWDKATGIMKAEKVGLSLEFKSGFQQTIVNQDSKPMYAVIVSKDGRLYVTLDDLATFLDKQLSKNIAGIHMYLKSNIRDQIAKKLNDSRNTISYQGSKMYVNDILFYEGQFVNKKMSGHGKLYLGGNLVINGGFQNNAPHGVAQYDMPSGEVYKGDFLNGRMTGKGQLYRGNVLLYDGEWLNDVMSGYGKTYDATGNLLYSGSIKNNIRSGFGILYANGKKKYQGDWVRGKMHGQGMLFDDQGQLSYLGTFENNQMEGNGAKVKLYTSTWYSDGDNNTTIKEEKETVYMDHGNFSDGIMISRGQALSYIGEKDENKVPNGLGQIFVETGFNNSRNGLLSRYQTIYDGAVKDGIRHGTGKAYLDGKLVYEGGFSNDKRVGKGKEYIENQLIFDGEWRNNRRYGIGKQFEYGGNVANYTGQGTVIVTEGQYVVGNLKTIHQVYKYVGDLNKGQMTGLGGWFVLNTSSTESYFTQTGSLSFIGNFEDGSREGSGTMYSGGSVIFRGIFRDDKRSGQGIIYNSNGTKQYDGYFMNDMKEGPGKLYTNGLLLYDGGFIADMKQGFGKLYENGQLVYVGSFNKDKKHGFGIVYKSGVVLFEGQFVNDVQQ